MGNKINIGCGQTPIKGWINYDNSWSIHLAKKPFLEFILDKIGILSSPQKQFISFIKINNILWADAIKYIPEENNSADVIYTSHMLEHIEKKELTVFFQESRRILKSGGIMRVSVPDIQLQIERYLKNEDADQFIEQTLLTRRKPKSIIAKIKYLIIGDRNHQWMYDGKSLCKLLIISGFKEVTIMKAGFTNIKNHSNLNLNERSDESIYVEAVNP